MASDPTVTVTGYQMTVYCLCGDQATGWSIPGEMQDWQRRWLAVHPSSVDGHGSATVEQAAEARRWKQTVPATPGAAWMLGRPEITAPIDTCCHTWVNGDGELRCTGSCRVILRGELARQAPPAVGLDWSRVVLVVPGRLLRPPSEQWG